LQAALILGYLTTFISLCFSDKVRAYYDCMEIVSGPTKDVDSRTCTRVNYVVHEHLSQ